MTQQYIPTLYYEPPESPSLNSLCQDLDMFISELRTSDYNLPSSQGQQQQQTQQAHSLMTNSSSLVTYDSRPTTPLPIAISATDALNENDDNDKNTLSPPASPSLFPRVPGALVQQPTIIPPSPPRADDSDDSDVILSLPAVKAELAKPLTKVSLGAKTVVYTTRTTSLDNRQGSSSTHTSCLSSAGRNNSTDLPRLTSLRSTAQRRIMPTAPGVSNQSSPAIMSQLANNFVACVKLLNKSRRIFCTEEYPLSFTGEEAVKIMHELLPSNLRPVLYRKVARAFIHTSPPLISPVSYSEKSLRKNTLYDSPNEVYTIIDTTLVDGYAQGVYTAISPCYSPSCDIRTGGCYAPICPNRSGSIGGSISDKQSSHLRRNMSLTSSSMASSHDTTLSRAWQATVPREILQNTPEQEIKRQEAIHELLYTEEDYVRDLSLLDELFAKALRAAQCIDEDRRDAFCDNVFRNYADILAIHKDMYRELRDYQSLCQAKSAGGFVDQIGDIFLRHLPRFMGAYSRYGPHVVLAEYAVKKEFSNNMLFHNFIREKEKQAECRKLPFRHFMVLPVTRLQRYPLLIDAVLKRTQDDHPDKDDLARCLEIVREIGARVDELASDKRMTLRIYEINDSLRYKTGRPAEIELGLTQRGRKLLHEGVVKRRTHIGVEAVDFNLFLFDHLLLMCKSKGPENYVFRKPIPLELLHIRDGTEGFALHAPSIMHNNSTTFSADPSTQNSPMLWPPSTSTSLMVQHLGRQGGDYVFYTQSAQQRSEWRQKVFDAKRALDEASPERRAFEIRSLSDTTFSLTGVSNHGKVTCSTAFVGSQGFRMVAIGTEMGIWMGIEGETNNLQKVLSISDVSQIAVLEEFHIFLVLADKTLTAYPLDILNPTSSNKPAERVSVKVASNVSFFNTGVCNNRTLVVVMKKKGLDSHFRTYDPICGDLRDPRNAKFLTAKTGFLSKAPQWFKLYKEFYIGAEASSVQFLKARLAVVCARGFEIIDLNRLTMIHNLPEIQDPDFDFVQQQYDQLVPLGMFRCRDNYLLCYDAFAFMVDIRGKYMRGNYLRIDWEGTPQSVAFSYPYVIAFDPQFIEVRHVETGELVQVLAGDHMRSLLYKQNAITPPVIHGVMAHPFKHGYQYVFHLAGVFEPPLFWQ